MKLERIGSDDIKELWRVTDLSLWATKETAIAIGHSMAAVVATERHLWMNLSDTKDKDRFFLLDIPLVPSGLFDDAVSFVVKRFQEGKKQAAAFQRFLSRRLQVSGAAGREQHQLSSSSSYKVQHKKSVASRVPPQNHQGSGQLSQPKLKIVSWTQLTAKLVQCWSSCKNASPQGYLPPLLRYTWQLYLLTSPFWMVSLWKRTRW